MNRLPHANQTSHVQLQRLILLRAIAVIAQFGTLLLAHYGLGLTLPWLPMLLTIGLLASFNLASWVRLRSNFPVSPLELFTQLSVDVLALSTLLFFAGGSTNPFVSLYLLPLVIAAATLPQRFTWAMALLTTTCYTTLMKFYIPIPSKLGSCETPRTDMSTHDHTLMGLQTIIPQDDAFNMHILGMWFGFVMSAAVVALFVVRMASAVRERDEKLARIREQTLRNERVVSLGMQAATAAHELGTPLSTLAVIIGELRNEIVDQPDVERNLSLLDEQVRNCKRILDKLLAHAQDVQSPTPKTYSQFIHETLDEWQLLRPTARYRFHPSQNTEETPRIIDNTLRAALLNLLNNAADASPQEMDIYLHHAPDKFVFEIQDHGPGLTPEAIDSAGAAFFTTKEEGRGLGLFLANATIEQLGGKVRLYNRTGGGATTEVEFPVNDRAL